MTLRFISMRSGPNKVADDLIFWMPEFIHQIGDSCHHMSMRRTCEFTEDSDWIPGTGPSRLRWWLHELLDDYIFYPIQEIIGDWVGDNDVGHLLRQLLGFFWGLNCGFPARDVALYTVWVMRGCKPRAVYRRREGKWQRSYP